MKPEQIFKEESKDLLEELEELIKEMREDGVPLTDDLRRIAKEMDDIWLEVLEEQEIEEEEDKDEEA